MSDSPKYDDPLLDSAHDDWKLSQDAYTDQRKREVEDLKFEAGEHFTDAELQWLKKKEAPAIQIDQISGQVAKVTNQPVHRMIVSPNGQGADPKSAEWWQGICRRIENLSGGEDIYKWARRHSAIAGRGAWRVRADYFGHVDASLSGQYDASAFQQDIRIEAFLYQHSVHPDPRPRHLDFADQRFCIITSHVEWSEFARLHPKFTDKDGKEFDIPRDYKGFTDAFGDVPPEWAGAQSLCLAERYYLDDVTVQLCLLKNGTVVNKASLQKDYAAADIAAERTLLIPKVKWMKYVFGKTLETADVPGWYIPVVRIVGERRIIEGKEDCRGMVRMSRWPARLVDFYETKLAQAVDLASYDTWLVTAESVEGHEAEYVSAHRDRPAMLKWNQFSDVAGQEHKPPQHITVAPEVSALVIAAQRAGMNLRHTLGVPDVTPEESRPEQSGKAIGLRQREQAQATSHYADSTAAGIRHTARIIMSMAREIYDAPRILRINGADEKPIEVVTYSRRHLESIGNPDAAQELAASGLGPDEQMRHMLAVDAGEFDVSVSAGKGNDTARQETVEVVSQLLPMLPPPMQLRAAAVIAKNIDAPGMQELAQQLQPPEDSGMVPKEQLQQVQQQAEQMLQQAGQKIQELEQERDSKRDELTVKMQIAEKDNEAKAQMKEMELRAELALEQVRQQGETQRAQIAAQAQIMTPQPNPSPEFGR